MAGGFVDVRLNRVIRLPFRIEVSTDSFFMCSNVHELPSLM